MRRRSFLVALALVVFLFGGAALVLFLVVGYEPDVYSLAAAPTGEARLHESEKFLDEFSHLYNNAVGADRDWYVQFSDEQINSYLEEGFIKQGLASRVLPDGVSRPHIVFEPGKAELAFRYGGAWNTIVTIDLRIWLAREEPNAVALELEGLRAGSCRSPASGSRRSSPRRGGKAAAAWTCRGIDSTATPSPCCASRPTRPTPPCCCRTSTSITAHSPSADGPRSPPCTPS